MELDEALNDALTQLAKAQAERAEIEARVDDLTAEVEGLRRAIERHQHAAPTFEVVKGNPWLAMGRTDAIEKLLDDETAMTPTELVAKLRSTGRNDNYNAVSAALAYLKRRGRAHQEGGTRGAWLRGPEPRPSFAGTTAVRLLEEAF